MASACGGRSYSYGKTWKNGEVTMRKNMATNGTTKIVRG